MIRYEIGIVDTRNVIKSILETYGYDFRDYALTSFKRRIEEIVVKHGFKDADSLITRMRGNKEFFETALIEILPETTEMFRDPSLWRALRDDIFPQIMRSTTKPKIWVAAFDSGEELYSLCITLKEKSLLDEVQIYASAINERVVKNIQEGKLDARKLETNEANYTRSNGVLEYNHYYTMKDGIPIMDTSLISNVKFTTHTDTLYTKAPGGIKLLLFRNQLLYYNVNLQEKVLAKVTDSLVPGGYLVIGAKETIDNTNAGSKYTILNDSERIYSKKLG
jgi:chemotaxis protein methyltransferase CheR